MASSTIQLTSVFGYKHSATKPIVAEITQACISQNIDTLHNYYKNGYDFDEITSNYDMPLLHLAILYGKLDAFNSLLEHGIKKYAIIPGR